MKESVFQSEFARSVKFLCETYGRHIEYTKIPDSPKGAEARFSARKGYDLFLIDQGTHIAIELKQAKKMSLPFNDVTDYQNMKLLHASLAGAPSWLVVNFRVSPSAREAKKRGKEPIISAYAVRIEEWEDAKAWIGRESLPLEWFEENAYELQRLNIDGKIGWDLGCFIENR